MKTLLSLAVSASLLLAPIGLVQAHDHGEQPKITFKTTQLTSNLYMLQGKGGNLALSTGEDGGLLVDDDYADIAANTKQTIAKLSGAAIKFLINTHWHFDHSGGNEVFGSEGSIIVSHKNVRTRLKNGGEIKAFGMTLPPATKQALPVLTFSDDISFHWNNDTINVVHINDSGHTDGDAVIYFKDANVVHMGDLYFAGMYPFIDASSGGSMKGYIEAVTVVINSIDEKTKVIPGHGNLSNKKQLTEFRDMLASVYQTVSTMKASGKTLEQIINAKPSAAFDNKWNGGFLKADQWIEIIYQAI